MGLPGSAIAVFRRHPLRLGLALLGLLLAAGAGASLVATWTCCEPRQPAASGAIEFQSLAGSERELAWGLEQRDLALLRAALPGARVGGMRLLQVRELVPPVDAQVAEGHLALLNAQAHPPHDQTPRSLGSLGGSGGSRQQSRDEHVPFQSNGMSGEFQLARQRHKVRRLHADRILGR